MKDSWKKKNYKEITVPTYKYRNGMESAIPKYYKDKLYTEEEREVMWLNNLNQGYVWVGGEKVQIDNEKEYYGLLEFYREKGIGKEYINKNSLKRHRNQDRFTEETYRTASGIKMALPAYYRQKIWTIQEREALRIIKEKKQTKYYNKTPIKVETIEQYKEYVDAVKYWQSIKKYDGKRKK